MGKKNKHSILEHIYVTFFKTAKQGTGTGRGRAL